MILWIYKGVTGFNFQIKIAFFALKIYFALTNSVDPNEMLHYQSGHLLEQVISFITYMHIFFRKKIHFVRYVFL